MPIISFFQFFVAIEGNLPTSFNHLRRIPRFLNQDRMDKLGPSDSGASTLKSSLPRITAAIKPAQHAKVELIVSVPPTYVCY